MDTPISFRRRKGVNNPNYIEHDAVDEISSNSDISFVPEPKDNGSDDKYMKDNQEDKPGLSKGLRMGSYGREYT